MTHSNANEGRTMRCNNPNHFHTDGSPSEHEIGPSCMASLDAPAPAAASQGDAPGFDEATESRWQKAIYEQCKRILPNVDGSGCESGDALDVTISEITQCFAHLQAVTKVLSVPAPPASGKGGE